MKLRIFGSANCPDCIQATVLIIKSKIPFDYVNVDDPKLEEFCDEHNVIILPHIQFISDSEEIIFEHIGPLEANQFAQYICDYCKGY